MEFPCSKCGACCRNVGNIKELPSTDGVCDHLKDNQCSIYEKRPMVCNVEKMADAFIGTVGSRTKKSFYRMNSVICNELITEAKLDPKYLIDIKKEYGNE